MSSLPSARPFQLTLLQTAFLKPQSNFSHPNGNEKRKPAHLVESPEHRPGQAGSGVNMFIRKQHVQISWATSR